MKNLKNIKYVFLGLIAALLFLTGMRTDNNCLGDVKQVFNAMNETVMHDKVCYLKYVVTGNLTSKDEHEQEAIHTNTFEMITSKTQSRIYSQEMIIFKDEKYTFSILPSRKIIYWADAIPSKKGEHLYDQLSLLQDSIFRNVKEQKCIQVKDKAYTKIIHIDLNERMSSYMGIKSASYFINDVSQQLNKVMVEYLPGNQFTRVEYDFKEVDLDYKKTDMDGPVQKLVFENGQKLQAAYQGFQIKDNRKK